MNWYTNYQSTETASAYVAELCNIVKASTGGKLVALATIDPTTPHYQKILQQVQSYIGKGGFQALQPAAKAKILKAWMETSPQEYGLGIRDPELQNEILNYFGINVAGTQVLPTSKEFRERADQQMRNQYHSPAPVKGKPDLIKEYGPGGSAKPYDMWARSRVPQPA